MMWETWCLDSASRLAFEREAKQATGLAGLYACWFWSVSIFVGAFSSGDLVPKKDNVPRVGSVRSVGVRRLSLLTFYLKTSTRRTFQMGS